MLKSKEVEITKEELEKLQNWRSALARISTSIREFRKEDGDSIRALLERLDARIIVKERTFEKLETLNEDLSKCESVVGAINRLIKILEKGETYESATVMQPRLGDGS